MAVADLAGQDNALEGAHAVPEDGLDGAVEVLAERELAEHREHVALGAV